MIKPYNGAKAEKFINREPLPRGAYVLQIVGAKVESYDCELNVGGELIQLPVAIERKMSLDELCQCFTGGRKRFQREFERAKDKGIKLYLLVENADWEKIYAGEYRSMMKAESLIGSMLAWSIRYGAQFFFCKPSTTARMIRKILHYEAKEWLEHDEQSIAGDPPESQSG